MLAFFAVRWYWAVSLLTLVVSFVVPFVMFYFADYRLSEWQRNGMLTLYVAMIPWSFWVCPWFEAGYQNATFRTQPADRLRQLKLWVFAPALFATLGAAASALVWLLRSPEQSPEVPHATGICVVAGGVLWLIGRPVSRWVDRRFRETMAGRGQCARCGYDLRGNPDAPCPECGEPTLRVRDAPDPLP